MFVFVLSRYVFLIPEEHVSEWTVDKESSNEINIENNSSLLFGIIDIFIINLLSMDLFAFIQFYFLDI